MTHLGVRVTALVDGELDHAARDRALAHLAHCLDCRAEVEAYRRVKELLASTPTPPPPAGVVDALLSLAEPGGPLPPPPRRMPGAPLGSVVPQLPPPGRGPRLLRRDARRPGSPGRARAGALRHTRVRVAALGGATLLTAALLGSYAGGGAAPADPGPVSPPVAELSVEHGRTATAVTVGDPGMGLMTGATASGR